MIIERHDPKLSLEIRSGIAEVGTAFVCKVSRSPVDGELNRRGIGKVRAVRVSLNYTTEGRGDTDRREVDTVEIAVDEFGMARGEIALTIPPKGPISYDGQLIVVRWYIEARTDIAMQLDQRSSAEVLVVPKGGVDRYHRPHPLSVR